MLFFRKRGFTSLYFKQLFDFREIGIVLILNAYSEYINDWEE